MELIYTTRLMGFEPGKNYRNPRYFDRVEQADSVLLDGDFPLVREAYEAVGVSVYSLGKVESRPDNAEPGEQIDAQGLEPLAEPKRRTRKRASE